MTHVPLRRLLAGTLGILLCCAFLAPPAAAESGRRAPMEEALDPPGRSASVPARPPAETARELSDEEAAGLSARAEEPGPEVVGGALTNTQLTYAVIALATAVIVLIAK